MWQSRRELAEPWRTIPGWEYDLLRVLPADTANALYQRAVRNAFPRIWRDRTARVLTGGIGLALLLSVILVWAAGAALGLGPLGQLVLEIGFHTTVGAAVHHPLARRYEQQTRPYVRAALADVLMDYAEDMIAPPPPRPVRPRRAAQPRTGLK
jgi:hypothetical protein